MSAAVANLDMLGRPSVSLPEHLAIIDAICAQDPTRSPPPRPATERPVVDLSEPVGSVRLVAIDAAELILSLCGRTIGAALRSAATARP